MLQGWTTLLPFISFGNHFLYCQARLLTSKRSRFGESTQECGVNRRQLLFIMTSELPIMETRDGILFKGGKCEWFLGDSSLHINKIVTHQ
ncbi:hypothetical protein V1506DRAFT_196006 [Lipomyces tetrasporus]